MIYADVDFFIALAKQHDWLQNAAESVLEEHEGELYTSEGALLELLVISHRFEFDRMKALAYALEIASLDADDSVLFQAAEYMDAHGMTAFDAYHVSTAGEDPIVSSDTAFDDLDGVERIPLERRTGE